MLDRTDVEEIRGKLRDVRDVCLALGLLERARPNAGGLLVRCPAHADRTPSCSVTRGPDGTIRVRCFGCDLSGDVFTLIAAVEGLDPQRDFRRVLRLAENLAGGSSLQTSAQSFPAPPPQRPYPPFAEVSLLWSQSTTIGTDVEAGNYFSNRGLDIGQLDTMELVRVVPSALPAWAVYGRWSWAETGHRSIVPVFDEGGQLRSVRACRVGPGVVPPGQEIPKRLPPKGYRAEGLIMANALGRIILASGAIPSWWRKEIPMRIVICEGEPDFLTWASAYSDGDELAPAVLGVVSGSWTGNIASRIPDNAQVLIGTHNDTKGDSYAREIGKTLAHRADVRRSKGPQ
jgi:hypothetical protein